MGVGGWLATVFGAIALAVISRLVCDEFVAWSPRLQDMLIHLAARRLPASQSRYEEEWQAHVTDIPGQIGKLISAIGCVIASYRLPEEIPDSGEPTMEEILASFRRIIAEDGYPADENADAASAPIP